MTLILNLEIDSYNNTLKIDEGYHCILGEYELSCLNRELKELESKKITSFWMSFCPFDCTKIGQKALDELAERLQSYQSLRHFKLSYTKLDYNAVSTILVKLNPDTIVTLHLVKLPLGNAGLAKLKPIISKFVSLRSLDLSFSTKNKYFGIKYSNKLTKIIKKMPSLEYLNLSGLFLEDAAVCLIAKCIVQNNPSLENLDLYNNKITSKCSGILKLLERSPKLRYIGLYGNPVGRGFCLSSEWFQSFMNNQLNGISRELTLPIPSSFSVYEFKREVKVINFIDTSPEDSELTTSHRQVLYYMFGRLTGQSLVQV